MSAYGVAFHAVHTDSQSHDRFGLKPLLFVFIVSRDDKVVRLA
jgi:hypothetical protein